MNINKNKNRGRKKCFEWECAKENSIWERRAKWKRERGLERVRESKREWDKVRERFSRRDECETSEQRGAGSLRTDIDRIRPPARRFPWTLGFYPVLNISYQKCNYHNHQSIYPLSHAPFLVTQNSDPLSADLLLLSGDTLAFAPLKKGGNFLKCRLFVRRCLTINLHNFIGECHFFILVKINCKFTF